MKKPDIPENEAERLNALRNLQILDTQAEERFDRLARMAKRMFQVPIALVSLVDENRQWFKSSFGVEFDEVPRDYSICGHAIQSSDILVIPDTKKDERFADNPMVTGEPHVRFYAGKPIKTQDGFIVGTLCIIDKVPRIFHPEDVDMLEDMARMVEQEIAAVQLATMDDLTGISNRRGFYMIAEHSLSLCIRHKSPAVVALFDLDGFKPINDQYGHAEGDEALRMFANQLKQFFRESDLVGRFGGDEFAVLMLNTNVDYAQRILDELRKSLKSTCADSGKPYAIDFSVGLSKFDPAEPRTIHHLVEEADRAMYQQKKKFEGDA